MENRVAASDRFPHCAGAQYSVSWYARVACRVGILVGSMVMGGSGLLACRDLSGLAGKQALPSGISDPSVYRSAAGALMLYQTTVAAFQFSYGVQTSTVGSGSSNTTYGAFMDFVIESGELTDELQAGDFGCVGIACSGNVLDSLDARQLPDGSTSGNEILAYQELQELRNGATLGIGALATYDPTASSALRGHLYALAGYADLLLADLYCSGVPLSTLNFTGATSFTYAASSTRDQVYQAALAQFDTAIALSGDSVRIQHFALVGKSRALLALNQLPQAAQIAAQIPDGFTYQFLVDWTGGPTNGVSLFGCGTVCGVSVSDREGFTGLPYRSSGDPRTASQLVGSGTFGEQLFAPVKYGGATPTISPVTVADWIEARLIQAEAAYHGVATGHGSWLDQLNTLRRTATVPGQTAPLATLADPGLGLSAADADTARVNLLFRERAYWLFLTGHRQGDLRRMIRQYGRKPDQVYPTGLYPILSIGRYGEDVTVPIPLGEQQNPKFHGCLDRKA